MYDGQTVGVVIPAYNEAGFVGEVIETLPAIVDRAYVIDDCSTDDTWSEIETAAMAMNEGGATDDARAPAIRSPADGSGAIPTRDRTGDGPATARDREPGPGATETGRELADGTRVHTDGGHPGPRVVTVRHARNHGVGGAIKTGYELAREDGIDVVAVMNGDGQMDPSILERIIDPIAAGRADYAKGNRLDSPDHRASMPRWRLFGNAVLTYLTKCVSGYWGMKDPQNGYTAISSRALEAIDVGRLYEGYGFCNDVLVHLNVHGFRIEDVPMRAQYGDEQSHIRYSQFVPSLSWLLLRRGLWRYRRQYAGSGLRPPFVLLLAGGLGGAVGLAAFGLTALTVGLGSSQAILSILTALLGGLFVVLAVTMDRLRGTPLDRDAADAIGGERS